MEVPADACCDTAWQSNLPRFTPFGNRSDLGFRPAGGATGGDGSLGGVGSAGSSCSSFIAKSTLLRRLEALTGGEEGGARCFGVSKARTLGTGTFPLGILGVFAGGWWDTTGCGAGVANWRRSALAFVTFGGVPGSETSDGYAG